jgi:hypothetical protein
LAVVTWSYPRGEGITDKKGRRRSTSRIRGTDRPPPGSHVVKVKPPGDFI